MKQDQKYKHKLKLNINWCEIARKNDDILNLNLKTSISNLFIATQIGFNIFMLLLCSGDFIGNPTVTRVVFFLNHIN